MRTQDVQMLHEFNIKNEKNNIKGHLKTLKTYADTLQASLDRNNFDEGYLQCMEAVLYEIRKCITQTKISNEILKTINKLEEK